MAMTAGNHTGQSYSEINMTPLIDVMLVLLIIFIITIPRQTHAIKIDNPLRHPNEQLVTPPEVIDLQIDFDGTLHWNKQAVDRTTMQRFISAEAAKSTQPEVHITVDKFAKYEIVTQTLADLQIRGLKKNGLRQQRILLTRSRPRGSSRPIPVLDNRLLPSRSIHKCVDQPLITECNIYCDKRNYDEANDGGRYLLPKDYFSIFVRIKLKISRAITAINAQFFS